MKRVRCAIYTRKSSEEGLEQDFNSLHAQRDACAAYVLSQASEGWILNPDAYDDGGISGGTLQRPALQRLLADIAEGRIDIVVVYKVDRLTRSLLDFSKLVEAFDKAEVSFVSITQSFNTTTSMGRLTLNMLLSFAQFEREVTAERIRDKIAASKAKGMWMGGTPPLGYAKNERSLKVVEAEACFVRDIFTRYLKCRSVGVLADELRAQGILAPIRKLGSGRITGGKVLSRGQLYFMLNNPIYTGRIRHREKTYVGRHPAIIDPETWDATRQTLADNTQGEERRRGARPSVLAGLVRDERGEPFVASHACKGNVRYRYYLGKSVRNGCNLNDRRIRIPAKELEDAVAACIAKALSDPLDLAGRLATPLDMGRLSAVSGHALELAGRVQNKAPDALRKLIATVHVMSREIRIELQAAQLAGLLGLDAPTVQTVCLVCPARLARTGHTMRLIQDGGRAAGLPEPKDRLVRIIIRARQWWERLIQGDIDIATIAREEKLTASYVTRVTRLAFLSPGVVQAIVRGEEPARLEAKAMIGPGFPASWAEQERQFLG